jgi:hypothetical protein
MDDEIDCTEAIYLNYVETKSQYDVFLFFEGKDDYKYYCIRITPYVGNKKFIKYNCNKKENVIEVKKMIKDKTISNQNKKLLFFIDNDFDKEKLNDSDIYVTPTYAIENFYISDDAIKRTLIGELGLSLENSEDKEDLESAFNYLIEKRTRIINNMLFSNAWYSLQKNKSKGENGTYPILSGIKEYSKIDGIRDVCKLKQMVPNNLDVTNEELTNEIAFLSEKPIERLRGKYFEQTMPFHFMEIFVDSNKKIGRELLKKKRKVNINIGKENMVSILSQYADYPECLKNYISQKLVF